MLFVDNILPQVNAVGGECVICLRYLGEEIQLVSDIYQLAAFDLKVPFIDPFLEYSSSKLRFPFQCMKNSIDNVMKKIGFILGISGWTWINHPVR